MKKISDEQLKEIIRETLEKQINESAAGKVGALGLAAALGLGALNQSCTPQNEPEPYTTNYEPHWTHEGPYTQEEMREKTWNTHNERGDWDNVENGEGYIYQCKTRCGGGWKVWVIFADKSTGLFFLPQECREYLYGRYYPNANCFENANSTDHINTNGLERLDNNSQNNAQSQDDDTTMYLEENKTVKLTESQLGEIVKCAVREIIKESLKK